MKVLVPIFVAGLLSVAGVTLVGCSNSQPPDNQGTTAGGNGAFGTNPARNGSYQGEQSGQQPAAPATQPSGS